MCSDIKEFEVIITLNCSTSHYMKCSEIGLVKFTLLFVMSTGNYFTTDK